ncbi:unnamed protein product [Rangifer tarandus platyrhynchus]|uniref:Uncharacterized protein n=2 Tax=Rangifer tarandus platyrhynchus TaxID=3082113 RepID=A0ACB0ED09_RANTA|nr:unnamed protein product [Rangifer tarandus platyrhynchus]CAI9698485.1 unnamed protein product [Rangifer tarandus platyrhynchus]
MRQELICSVNKMQQTHRDRQTIGGGEGGVNRNDRNDQNIDSQAPLEIPGAPNKFALFNIRRGWWESSLFAAKLRGLPRKREGGSGSCEPRVTPSVTAAPGIRVVSGVGARGERAAVARRNEGPASVATRTPSALSPAPDGQSRSVEIARVHPRLRAPKLESKRRVAGGGAGDAQETYLTGTAFGHLRCRDQLRHSVQVVGTLSLPRVERRAVQARGGGGGGGGGGVSGAGPGPGRSARSRQVPGPEPRVQTRPGRASAGARGCECAMRARRGQSVSPLSPSFPAGPAARLSPEQPPKPPLL